LTIDHAFGSVVNGVDFADVDDDDISFSLASYNNITLSSALVGEEDPTGQFGAITATVNAGTPDGTVITGTFYVAGGIERLQTLGPVRALAADDDIYLRSTVRMQVSNPAPAVAVTPTVTPTLPATGADSKSQLPYLLLFVSIIIACGEFYVLKRGKK